MKPALKPCGTLAAYQRHIRHREAPCPDCRAANAAQHLASNRRRADNVPEHVHGSANGYCNYLCRCCPCADAWAVSRARTMCHQPRVTAD